ncbi:MAG: enoyl-ACP reductase [Desulfuromonadales bacterium]|nr:enoyl-ACP reductase [Desulfuromonadales bacterium]
MSLLSGKKAVILGVANDKSIAWAIAQAFKREGAEIALTYAGEAFEKRVKPLAETIDAKLVVPCDVTKDSDIDAAFKQIGESFGGIDILVHSVAFANKDELKGSFLDTTREGFAMALDISAYSFIACLKAAHPFMQNRSNPSALTMTYYGGQKVFPNYNIMGVAKAALEMNVRYLAEALGQEGIRVNGISAGPIKTLAAAGVGGFNQIAGIVQEKAPMRKNISQEDVANAALYLCSDLGKGVTGEIHFVDNGYNIIGL